MNPVSTPDTIAERYTILEELGQGGMATVYRAYDQTLAREVAVKRLHPHLAKVAEHRARFEREARAVARLDHPGIVKIYDFSSPESDDAFIVMELIDGQSLAALLERAGPLPPELAAVLIAETLDALELAHQHQIIHRDIKPENVMVRQDASVVILDFGLANLLDQARITRTGALLGSPAFMAPELMEGRRADIASDLFAIGATFYRLITGQDAFEGDHPAQILRAIERGDHTPAHRRDARVGRRLSQLISRWISVAPEKRPSNVTEAQKELRNLVDVPAWRPDLKRYINEISGNTLGPDGVSRLEARICEALMRRVDALRTRGATLEATYELERLLAYQPDSPEALAKLSQLHASDRAARGPGRLLRAGAVALFGGALAGGALWLGAKEPVQNDAPSSTPTRKAPAPLATTTTQPTSATSPFADIRPIQEDIVAAIDAAHKSTQHASDAESARPARIDQRDAPPPVAPASASAGAGWPTDQPPAETSRTPPKTLKQRFRVIPAAATLIIDGKRYSAIEAARGIELPVGPTQIEATSPGCQTLQDAFEITPESSQRAQRVVLRWLPGYIELVTDRNALVWLDERSRPVMVNAGGASEPIEVSFGKADEAPAQRQLELRVASHRDLTRILSRTVTVRPGQTTSLALSLADADSPR
ncbi:serine/threonine protein kinase [Lujinxingia vulgaris]|uniref:Serine/threonine protein kinase n=1 Tax=Lujinxingia vulgaris TaxID=2600176 RepID=A0A5C6XCD8_9DELT|nr:serine/threonine-protein kinase [Lujinxingia vulgaris]TXD36427.1 serine/threonine protein kinase [Lujinxingia vulgaris]